MAPEDGSGQIEVKARVDYKGLEPGRDYFRQEVQVGSSPDFSSLYPSQQMVERAAKGLDEIMGCKDVAAAGNGGQGWERSVYTVSTNDQPDRMYNWTEVEFRPVVAPGEDPEARPGFVLRLDPWSGNPVLFGADGKPDRESSGFMAKGAWTHDAVTELKNNLVALSGKSEQEIIVQADPAIARVVDNSRSLSKKDLAIALVGREITENDLKDPDSPTAQALAGACLLTEMASTGAGYSHPTGVKFLGLVPGNTRGDNGQFQEDRARNRMVDETRKLRTALENGSVMGESNEIRMADTQGNEWVVTKQSDGFAMYLERPSNKSDRKLDPIPIGRSTTMGDAAQHVTGNFAGHNMPSPGWHGDSDDRHYQETWAVVHANTDLYEAGVPVPLLNAATCLEYKHHAGMRGQVFGWTEENNDMLELADGTRTTWKDLKRQWSGDIYRPTVGVLPGGMVRKVG